MPSRVRFLLMLALALLPCASAVAGPADHKYLTLRGRVADGNGDPVAGARVQATGTRQASAVTGSDGRYQLSLDLGTLATLRDHPAAIWVRASLEGWRIVVAGGAPSLAIELSVETTGQPQLIARSNFGLIADALLDALAPPGDRTAGIQAVFTASRGAATDTLAPLAAERRTTVLMEPWLVGTTAAAPTTKSTKPTTKSSPPATQSTPPATKSLAPPATKSAPPPSPSAAARDSARRTHEADEKAKAARAAAVRDSTWYAQHAAALAQKSRQDSLRAIREAAEDSARKAHIVTVHPSATAVTPATPPKSSTPKTAAPAPKTSSAKQPVASIPPPPPSHDKKKKEGADPVQATPVRSRPSFSEMSGLSRVQPHGGPLDTIAVDVTGIPLDPSAAQCGCRVKGTVELEFHHLLSSPMRVEVAVQDVPGMRDTVQLFMGSPRGFDFPRVPCGRLSIRVAAFSQRPFDVITPDEVAPFDCRDGGLRQVRIVIAPR